MLEQIDGLPPGIDGIEASGQVKKEDYERVFEPLVDEARREGRRIRLLYELGSGFDGFTAGAAWEDARIGLGSLRLFEGVAIVTGTRWIEESAKLMGFVMPCPVRVFASSERAAAVAWLDTLPQGPGVAHRMDPASGVMVAEVEQPLRAQDFDALAATADGWIERHGGLPGIVIHARAFPGWENLGAILRHVRFVRDHHRVVGRVALAADSKLAGLVPRIAEHFTEAEVRRFGYDEIEEAIAWAGSGEG